MTATKDRRNSRVLYIGIGNIDGPSTEGTNKDTALGQNSAFRRLNIAMCPTRELVHHEITTDAGANHLPEMLSEGEMGH